MSFTPSQAATELLARRIAKKSLTKFIDYIDYGVVPAKHHQLIIDKLEAVERGECKRLMLFLPPGSAKSTYASILFPAWYLGKNSAKSIIGASHSGELAERFGRRVRNIVTEPSFSNVFNSTISTDSAAAGRWETTAQSEYYAVGVGGSVTGRRADLGIIDDPVKSREEADSELQREKVWEWYKADFFTRLKPNASVILIMCMTGDTLVMLADGTEKPLRDIRPKDVVATYKNGILTTSTVKNWQSNGLDSIYKIKMTSGIIVKANKRHPFLVNDDGEVKWIRLKDLRPGQRICRVNGESGKARLASQMDASNQLHPEDIAPHITTRSVGQTGFAHLLQIVSQGVRRALSIAMVYLSNNMTSCLQSKMVNVLYANNCQQKMYARTGAESFALTTATTQVKSEGFFATIATLLSDMQKLPKQPSQPPNTSDFTLDEILDITPAGVEEVFDVQIEDTENFIANGLVSHNTRWHEDDLAGRLLQDAKEGGEQWDVLSLSMEAEEHDPLGRAEGELLWPEWFTDDMVTQAKRDARNWLALYQQKPRPDSGGEFKREWIQHYKNKPLGNKYILVDPASEKKKTSDYTAIFILSLGQDNNIYVLDMIRDRLNLTERADLLFKLHKEYQPLDVAYEKYGMQTDIEHIKDRQERENYRFHIREVGGAQPKNDRIRRMIPLFEAQRIYFPQSIHKTQHNGEVRDLVTDFIEQEYLAFPVGKHDDMMDCLARLLDIEYKFPLERPVKPARHIARGMHGWMS